MFQGLNQSELLDLVEGEHDPRAADFARVKLAKRPEALAELDRMRRDRASLQQLPLPEMPVNFSSKLESLLARPMLIETLPSPMLEPGEFRRQYRKRTHRVRWSRLAAAAVVFLALCAGIWAAVNSLRPQNPNGASDQVAVNQNDASNALTSGTNQPREIDPSNLKGVVHHFQPQILVAHADSMGGVRETPDTHSTLSGPVAASFVVVMSATDLSAAESAIGRAIGDVAPDQAALVRNFSFTEAMRLVERHGRTPNETIASDTGPAMASTTRTPSRVRTPAEMKTFANAVRQAMRSLKDTAVTSTPDAAMPQSAHLLGPEQLDPSLEQQLDFSSRGAVLTVTVPVSRLSAFIQKLAVDERQSTALRSLPQRHADLLQTSAPATDAKSVATWITEGSKARQSILALEQNHREAVVLVPVIVQTPATGPRK
jgi:hypothetical protein